MLLVSIRSFLIHVDLLNVGWWMEVESGPVFIMWLLELREWWEASRPALTPWWMWDGGKKWLGAFNIPMVEEVRRAATGTSTVYSGDGSCAVQRQPEACKWGRYLPYLIGVPVHSCTGRTMEQWCPNLGHRKWQHSMYPDANAWSSQLNVQCDWGYYNWATFQYG